MSRRNFDMRSFDPLASGGPAPPPPPPPHASPTISPPPLDARQVQSLQQQGFSSGLIRAFTEIRQSFPLRFWILDNSESMNVRDSHRITGTFDNIQNVPVTRWEELQDCVVYHAQMAAQFQLKTRFALLNPPNVGVGPQYFAVGEQQGTPAGLAQEMATARHVMTNARPGGPTPLTEQLLGLERYIASVAPELRRHNQTVTIVLATQGLPTTDTSAHGPAVAAAHFTKALRLLEQLPVWVVIRLCTDDEKVFDFYNSLDAHIDLPFDVLDDFFGESLEVYLRNPWLTYALPLHRFREMGFRINVLDAIDERALTLAEVRNLCGLLFATSSSPPLPDPAVDWNAFLHAVSSLLSREKLQWNPVTRKLTPWINLHDLNRLYGGGGGAAAAAGTQQQQQPAPPPPRSFPYAQPGLQQPQPPNVAAFASSSRHPGQAPTYATPSQPPPPPQAQRPAASAAAAASVPPGPHAPPRPPAQSAPSSSLQQPPPGGGDADMSSLKRSLLTQWALQPPNFQAPRPISYLLGTLQTTFPPAFGVEPHAYFDKWKPFSMDALSSGQDAVIRRAVRKCKFFLHPDKLPRDFSEKQSLLCKTLWDVVADASEAVKKD